MEKEFESPTKWNDFYEKAWLERKKIMSFIIETGETNPLRVINSFLSLSRIPNKGEIPLGLGKNDLSVFHNTDKKYVLGDVRNVTVVKNRESINIIPNEYLPGGVIADNQLAHRNKYSIASSYTDCNKMDFISDYCRHRKFDAVIELGSGYCQNLVRLYYQGGPKVPYYGGEFTHSGTQCAQMLSDLTDEFELVPFRFDFRHADLSIIPKYDNVLVFSSHAIEQVNIIPDDLLPVIARVAKKVTCIHMEPFGFQMAAVETESEVDKDQREYFKKNNWNMNLLQQLAFHNCRENIDLHYIGKNLMGGNYLYNPSSIALWKSDNSETIC